MFINVFCLSDGSYNFYHSLLGGGGGGKGRRRCGWWRSKSAITVSIPIMLPSFANHCQK